MCHFLIEIILIVRLTSSNEVIRRRTLYVQTKIGVVEVELGPQIEVAAWKNGKINFHSDFLNSFILKVLTSQHG